MARELWQPIVAGLAVGTLARLYLLRVDYRHYPTTPHGAVTHVSLGFIAAFVGAVAVPALVEREFTAVTFLVLVAQQFREVRKMERDHLVQLEDREPVPRGPDYIERIALVFEARNYLTMFAALAASAGTRFLGPVPGLGLGLAALAVGTRLSLRPQTVGEIAVVRPGKLEFNGTVLQVEGITITAVGRREARERYLREGLGVVIEPRDDNARATLASIGQRQAIAHDAGAILGLRRDVGFQEFTPLVRLDLDTGRAALAIVPMEPDREMLLAVVRQVPVLETARSRPLASRWGRKAAD